MRRRSLDIFTPPPRTLLILGTVAALQSAPFVSMASAQTYSGTSFTAVDCGSTLTTPFPNLPATEDYVESSTCSSSCGIASASEVRWHRFANRGVLASAARVFGQQFIGSPCGWSAGGRSIPTQVVTAHDVVFTNQSNPSATGGISAKMNVEFAGNAVPGPACTDLHARLQVWAGPNEWSAGISSHLGGRYFGDAGAGDGCLAGYPNDRSVRLCTSSWFYPNLTVPTTIHLALRTWSAATLCELPNLATTIVTTDGILSLPRTGPVFNLPPGITCNSVELGIVNNQWVPAVPASVTSFGSGCPGSNAQPLVLSATSLPSVGNAAFALTLTGPPDGAAAYVFIALGLAPTPLHTGGSCFVYLDLTSALSMMSAGSSPLGPVSVTGGAATFPVPVPMLAPFLGLSAALQGVVFDGSVPGGVTLSNALSITIGM